MAGTHITATVDDKDVRATLAELAHPETQSLLPRLGEYLQTSTEDRFKTQTGPDGAAWAPLKKRYAKRKKYNADKVLTLRGYLRGGIRYQLDGPDAVQVGTNIRYGAIHQFGGAIDMPERTATVRYRSTAGKILFVNKRQKKNVTQKNVTIGAHQVKIPARPYLGISDADDARILQILQEWQEEQLKR